MINIIKQEIEIDETLKRRLEIICDCLRIMTNGMIVTKVKFLLIYKNILMNI